MILSPIERVFEILGGPSAIAKRFADENGKPLRAWAVSKWRRRVPPGRCVPLEEMTGGRVTRYQLRPDVFGLDPRRSEAPGANRITSQDAA